MIFLYFFVLLIVGIRGFLVQDGLHTVTTPVGDITGFTAQIDGGKFSLNKYLGIPYAEPPIGNRRLAKPVPKSKFVSAYDATKARPACLQFDIPPYSSNVPKSEDCLFLSIYTPEKASYNASTNYAVMLYIHGGGFVVGMSNMYNGDVLTVLGDVIVVTINYRLAELGFMTTGDSSLPGNLGLWDQHLAIKWVHDNIQSFGGDPSRITIFGASAGSASVIYQTMYPGNKGLFKRAIAESGSANSPWAYMNTEKAVNQTRNISRSLGCSSQLSNDIVNCIRSKTSLQMNETMYSSFIAGSDYWAPVGDNEFVLDTPRDIIEGKSQALIAVETFRSFDLVIGVNSKEGLIDIDIFADFANVSVENFTTISKEVLEKSGLLSYYLYDYFKTEVPQIVTDAVLFQYTDWTDPNNDTKRTQNIIDLVSHSTMFVPAIGTANMHSNYTNKTSSTYFYKFSYRPLPHILPVPAQLDSPTTANHLDELRYLFPELVLREGVPVGNISGQMARTMMLMWSNFAKSGNPNNPVDVSSLINTSWPEYGSDENFLEISSGMKSSKSVQKRLAPKAFEFLTHLCPVLIEAAMIHDTKPT